MGRHAPTLSGESAVTPAGSCKLNQQVLSSTCNGSLAPRFGPEEQTWRGSRAEEKTWTWRQFHRRALATCCDATGWQLAYLLYGRGLNAFALGEWKRARPDFERAATLVGSTGQFWYATYPPHRLGLLCLAEGREEEAAHYLNQALTLAERNHDMQALSWVQGPLAEWDLLAGRPEAARVRLAPLLDAPGLVVSYSRESLALLAWAYLELGEVDQAQALLAQVLSTARQALMGPTLVQALRVQALVLSKQERWQEAEHALQEALTLCRGMAVPYAEAKTLYAAGLISHQKRELAPARQRFEAALKILERLGERLYARHIEQLLGQGEHQ